MKIRMIIGALLLFCAAGCDDAAPGGSDEDLSGVVADLAGADLTGAGEDLAGADLIGSQIGDLGGEGSMCKTACDCMPGLGCFGGECRAGFNPVYCCTAKMCPAGSTCQDPDGDYRRCGMMMRPDGGVDICPLVNCTIGGVTRCMNAGCSMCVAGTGVGMRCAK